MPPLTSEAIALAMTLDDIIKMSRKSSSKARIPRVSNKSRRFPSAGHSQGISSKVQRYMDSRSSLRQGLLAQKSSSFQGNEFLFSKRGCKEDCSGSHS